MEPDGRNKPQRHPTAEWKQMYLLKNKFVTAIRASRTHSPSAKDCFICSMCHMTVTHHGSIICKGMFQVCLDFIIMSTDCEAVYWSELTLLLPLSQVAVKMKHSRYVKAQKTLVGQYYFGFIVENIDCVYCDGTWYSGWEHVRKRKDLWCLEDKNYPVIHLPSI